MAYFLGVVVALLVVALAQTSIVFLLGFFLGAHYRGSLGLGLLIVVLSVFSYAGLGFAFGARFAKRAEDVNGPVAAFGGRFWFWAEPSFRPASSQATV